MILEIMLGVLVGFIYGAIGQWVDIVRSIKKKGYYETKRWKYYRISKEDKNDRIWIDRGTKRI